MGREVAFSPTWSLTHQVRGGGLPCSAQSLHPPLLSLVRLGERGEDPRRNIPPASPPVLTVDVLKPACVRWVRLLLYVVQSLSRVQLAAIPWTAARQAPQSFTISWTLLKLMCVESVMPSNHLILCHLLLLLPSIFPSIKVFSNELALRINWPKIGASASASVLLMNIHG